MRPIDFLGKFLLKCPAIEERGETVTQGELLKLSHHLALAKSSIKLGFKFRLINWFFNEINGTKANDVGIAGPFTETSGNYHIYFRVLFANIGEKL